MASIMTTIELQDKFSTVVYGMIQAANLSISAMYDMREAVSSDMDTRSLEGAKEQLNQATLAANQLKDALRDVETFDISVSASHNDQFSVPAPSAHPDAVTIDNTSWVNFEQGVERVNQQMEFIIRKQEEIASLAESTDIVSPETMQEMEQITAEIVAVENQVSELSRQQINIGTDRANTQMLRLKGQIQQAAQVQQGLTRAMNNMDISDVNADYIQLTNNINAAQDSIRQNAQEQENFNQVINQGTINANNLTQTLKRMAATYISIQGLQKVIGLSDQLASTNAKLDMMNDGMRTTEELQDMIYVSAQRSRGSYLDMANSVAKLGNLAKDAFGSTEEVVAFSEQLNKQFILAGASTTEIKNATLQLTQALSSGVLRGDELNSIFEQAPTIIQSIADYMGVPIGQIRELASQGEITADIVKNAMFAAADETNAKFESMPKTFEQIGQSIQNTAIMAFEPVFTRLNEVANSSEFQELVDSLCQSFAFLAGVAVEVLDLLITMGGFVADNWAVIGPLIGSAVTALLLYNAALKIYNTYQRISHTLEAISAARKAFKTGATLAEAAATEYATGAQVGLNAAMLACPVMWIIAAILLVIAAITILIVKINEFGDESTSAIEKVCGAFAVAGAFIGNLFVSVINFVIDYFVNLWNFIAIFANFFANAFTDLPGAAARAFFDFIDLALAGIQALASAIDMLFGSGFADSVAGWRSNLDSWVTEKFGEGEVVMEKKNAQDYYLEGFDYEDAWNKGVELGGRFGGNSNIPSIDQYGDFDYSSYLTDISDDMGDIKDELGVSEEDLKYLRDIAEQEAINRFTTAEITIEQTNHNNVSGNMDLDGVIIGLTNAVSEAAGMITEGVH